MARAASRKVPESPRPDGGHLVKPERLQLVLEAIRDAGERGITKEGLVRRLGGVASRTVDRAVQLLEEQGARFGKARQGLPAVIHFTLEKAPDWDSKITPHARMALEVALMALEGTATELWFDQLEGLRALADSHLSTRDRDLFRALQEHVCVRGGADDQQALDTKMLTQVLLALGHPDGPRELDLTYKAASTGRTSARTVVPFTLTHDVFSGGAFLLAWDLAKREPRHFRLARIEEAKALPRRGLIPDKRPLEQARELQIGGWFRPDPPFRVGVRVGGTNWPQALLDAPPALPGITVRKEKGGTVLLSFQATEPSGPTRLILQFGADAEVLEPASLRDHLVKTLKTMAANYR
ncbi:MAG: WYL domain-containing protein [Geothrix sp.]|jgi:predicted DNA-binding transcriptional regulator YafY|uniref:WYL domain-containing protein n=1 Tax=Candidatus Geothrix odensensis TaxID=2954440 RepID=A0A936K8B5_9BACT|nr:WYL domain-containing protein [Candidatus Geothrix odensensis]MBP7618115.1 WYL domain-containing protein [Geothrix sp.]